MKTGDRIEDRSVWRGVVAGAVGGLVGSLAMKGFLVAVRRQESHSCGTELDQNGPAHKVAELAVRRATGQPLTRDGRRVAGELVHYAFGAAVGGFYGGLGEYWTWVRWASGTLFGTGVFVAADELSMPALGLVKKPGEEGWAAKEMHWLAHMAYGVPTEVVRSAVRRVL